MRANASFVSTRSSGSTSSSEVVLGGSGVRISPRPTSRRRVPRPREPTSGSTPNLTWTLGAKSQKELLTDAKEALCITGFIGGNTNAGTGDFSLGVVGFRVRNGEIAEPLAEMNLSGNHLEFWKKLVALGNDPFPYSSLRTPTLVFENVSVAGT